MQENDLKEILDDFRYLIEAKQDIKLLNILMSMHASDIADLAEILHSDQQRLYLFNLMEAEMASEAIMELDEVYREHLIEKMEPRRLSQLVDEMDSDDAADFVSEIPEEEKEKVLEHVEDEDVEEVRLLLEHENDTAGGIMALEIISVHDESTVDESIDEIRRKAEEVDDIYNIYVVDRENRLTGIVTMKDLILAAGTRKVSDIVTSNIVSVPVSMDQEDVAILARKYDLVSVPVVDEDGHLLGRITIDDIVDVMEEEATEDIHKMAGLTDEEEIRETAVFRIVRARIPWLCFGLFGGLIGAFIMNAFHGSIQRQLELSFFIPVIMAMAGNIGIQSSTLVVRGLATGEIGTQDLMVRCMKELRIALLNGLILSVLLYFFVTLYYLYSKGSADTTMLALVISTSLLSVIMVAGALGSTIPLILKRFDFDPALSTGPFITSSNDIIGIFIYLSIADFILNHG